MIDTVCFDFDGTIMDTNQVIIDSWQETFRTLQGREGDLRVILDTFGEPLEATMRGFFPDIPAEVSLEIYRKYQRDNFLSSIRLFPGIRELLDQLLQRQVRMALVTSRLRFTTEQAVERFDLGKYFSHIITADDVTRHKPDPQSIEIALERTGTKPENAIQVGDSMYDIMCARNAGVRAVLVSWSLTLQDQIRDGFPSGQEPDLIIGHPGEILDLL